MPMTLPYCQHNVLVCKRWLTSVLMSVRCGTFLLLHRKAIYNNFWWRDPNEPDTPLNYGQTKWNTSVILFIVNKVCQKCRICFVNFAASPIIIISSVIGKWADEAAFGCFIVSPTLFCGCEVWSLSTSNVHNINVVWNNGFRRILVASGERVLNCYKFYCNSLPICLLLLSLMKENFCFVKMFSSTNVILTAVSCLIRRAFM